MTGRDPLRTKTNIPGTAPLPTVPPPRAPRRRPDTFGLWERDVLVAFDQLARGRALPPGPAVLHVLDPLRRLGYAPLLAAGAWRCTRFPERER